MVNINHSVNAIRQPNSHDCWATCCAMVLGLHGINGVAGIKARASGVALNANGSIRPSSIGTLASRLSLHSENLESPPRPLSTALLSTVLRRSTAAAFGYYNYPGCLTSNMHVLLLYRVSGSDLNPMVYFIDPFVGRSFNYLLDEFNENLGSVDRVLYR